MRLKTYETKMKDRGDQKLVIGDYVKYWQFLNRNTRPAIGEVVGFNYETNEISIRRNGGVYFSKRYPTGVTKISKEEATIFLLEQDAR